MSEQNCGNCFYRSEIKSLPNKVWCLRYPPIIKLSDEETIIATQPMMFRNHVEERRYCWCGEWLHESLNKKYGGAYKESVINGKDT